MSGKRGTVDLENERDAKWRLDFEQPTADTLLVRLSGAWRLDEKLPDPAEIQRRTEANPSIRRMAFDAQGLTGWDTSLLTFLGKVIAENDRHHIETDRSGLPDGVGRLLNLAAAVPERADTGQGGTLPPWLARVGLDAMAAMKSATAMLAFLGEAFLSVLKLLRGTARFRRADFLLLVQGCGPQALPIVTLISFLVGVILAYVGAVHY